MDDWKLQTTELDFVVVVERATNWRVLDLEMGVHRRNGCKRDREGGPGELHGSSVAIFGPAGEREKGRRGRTRGRNQEGFKGPVYLILCGGKTRGWKSFFTVCVCLRRGGSKRQPGSSGPEGSVGLLSTGETPVHKSTLVAIVITIQGASVRLLKERGPSSKHDFSNTQTDNNRDKVCSLEGPIKTKQNRVGAWITERYRGTNITLNMRA